MQDEARLLLQDFVSDIHNYAAILRAIAQGYRPGLSHTEENRFRFRAA
jgi:hypothetical protein